MTHPKSSPFVAPRAAPPPVTTAADPPSGAPSSRRGDIQTLRAIAVLLVISDHLIRRPSGGFIGVDVFFVISGFLITGLLLREHERTGRISFRRFYLRRVKRLLPAAVTVTVVTVAASFAIFSLVRSTQILVDAAWVSLFAANWRFVSLGTDYLHATDSTSPLQHYWSLAVEEQFYFLWPVLMVAAFAFARWRLRRPDGTAVSSRRAPLAVLSLVTAGSLAWSLWESAAHPTSAYFSTGSRIWELGVGALLAFAAPSLRRLPDAVRTWFAWAGIAGIVASALLIDTTTRMPAPGAVAPVLFTAVVIAAGTGTNRRQLFPLNNPVGVYIGTISYSLYLWHLPVIVVMGALFPDLGRRYELLSLALIAVLSVLSYHWIETPLRTRSWRFGMPRAAASRPRRPLLRPAALLALVAAVVGIGFVTAAARVPARVETMDISALTTPVAAAGFPAAPTALEFARADAVTAALAATAWPTLSPDITRLGLASRAPEWMTDDCLQLDPVATQTPEKDAQRCVYGTPDAPHTIAVIGDSVAISWVQAIRAAAGTNWRIEVYTMAQCPAVDLTVNFIGGAAHPQCDSFRRWALARVATERPERVVLSSTPNSLAELADGATGAAALGEWRAGTDRTLAALSGMDVTVLDPPAEGASLATCARRWSVPADCVGTPSAAFVEAGRITREVARQHPGVTVPATISWFCSAEGRCPAFVGTTPVTADGLHLSAAESRELAPLVGEALRL
ncbi:acyltransferase family protein [Glaciihabitans sp. dw_435]|uniref:acyltransferase family protein n=1 Tax=Glaciihabitans sp. dw_435 TaxID=2720081 RepID=UPI001BD38640|nr:acyltransferase family protein [Glaciihabitans sp. dw_435]